MPSKEELFEKIRRRPNSTKIKELEDLLLAYGFEYRRTEGSHYIYKRAGSRPIPIPHHAATADPHIVRTVLEAIEALDD